MIDSPVCQVDAVVAPTEGGAEERDSRRSAREDLLRGAEAAGAGKPDEARDAFRRGETRVPLDPTNLKDAAKLRARARFERGFIARAWAILFCASLLRDPDSTSASTMRAVSELGDAASALCAALSAAFRSCLWSST